MTNVSQSTKSITCTSKLEALNDLVAWTLSYPSQTRNAVEPQPTEKYSTSPPLAGDSIKPRVKRSGTLGKGAESSSEPVERATELRFPAGRCRPHAGWPITNPRYPGFRFASPWALCFRLLRRLVEWLQLTVIRGHWPECPCQPKSIA